MNPMTEKMTKPAKMLVPQLRRGTMSASLKVLHVHASSTEVLDLHRTNMNDNSGVSRSGVTSLLPVAVVVEAVV